MSRNTPPRFNVNALQTLAQLGGLALGLTLLTGCPIDADALATDVTAAALDSVADSLVSALSTYLEGN